MTGLSLQNISKSYGQEKILEDFSLDIKPGEFVVLVGPSGSGKSTIIRLIAGLEEHSSGSIKLSSEEIINKAPKDRNVSMVFQNYALYPHKTVYENIAFPLKMSKSSKEFIEQKVNDVSKKLEINHLLERKPKQLSGGQRQRVALARAMVKQPKVFLMDEPLSNLDAKLRAQMRIEIAHLHRDSKSIFVYVTHDQIEALSLGDRIVILNEGKVQQIGTPKEVYNNPANTFVASFIGSPPTNLIREKDRIVGIRPEFLHLSQEAGDDRELTLSLQNIELLGKEYLIYGTCRGLDNLTEDQVIIRTTSNIISDDLNNKFKESSCLKTYYSSQSVYYFDTMTGSRL